MDVFGIAVSAGGAFLRDAAIAAGHDLGIFEALARGGPSSLDDLAGAIGVAAGRRRLRALLDVLAALGALACDRSTTPRFAAADVSPSRPEVAPAGWGRIAEVIGRDRALSDPDVASPDGARRFHHHLAIAGAEAAGELVAQLGTTSLLDLGAGAGAYTKAFLAARPAGHATLVDTREVLGLAADWLGPLAVRARFVEGDASTVAAGDGYGAALLANVLHLHPPAMCARLCTAAARAVAPGGVVVIKDLRIDEDRTGPIEGLLFALNMALYTEAGDVYPTSQLRAWLAGAGLGEITEHRLVAAPDAVVVIARRPLGATLAPEVGRPRRERSASEADAAKPGMAIAVDVGDVASQDVAAELDAEVVEISVGALLEPTRRATIAAIVPSMPPSNPGDRCSGPASGGREPALVFS